MMDSSIFVSLRNKYVGLIIAIVFNLLLFPAQAEQFLPDQGEPFMCWPQYHSQLPLCKSFGRIQLAMGGPGVEISGCALQCYDIDGDGDIDLWDWAEFMTMITDEAYTQTLASFDSCGWSVCEG